MAPRKGKGYNPVRGAKVIEYAARCWTARRPWPAARTKIRPAIGGGRPAGRVALQWQHHGLKNASQFKGYQGEAAAPSVVLLQHNGLHLDIRIDRSTPIGQSDPLA